MLSPIVILSIGLGIGLIALGCGQLKGLKRSPASLPLTMVETNKWQLNLLWNLLPETSAFTQSESKGASPNASEQPAFSAQASALSSESEHRMVLKVVAPTAKPFGRDQLQAEFEKWGFQMNDSVKDHFEKKLHSTGSAVTIDLSDGALDQSQASHSSELMRQHVGQFLLMGEYRTQFEGEVLLNTLVPLARVMTKGLDGILTTEAGEVFTDAEFLSYQEALQHAPKALNKTAPQPEASQG